MGLLIDGMRPGLGTGGRQVRRLANPIRPPPGGPEHRAPQEHQREPSGGANEQFRAEVAALDEALQSAEAAIGTLEAARGALGTLEPWLDALERCARPPEQGAGLGAAPSRPREAQAVLAAMDEFAREARFGELRLLDGSLSAAAAVRGPGLSLVGISERTRSSPPEGYPVVIHAEATRATLLGDLPLGGGAMAAGARLAILCEGRRVEVQALAAERPAELLARWVAALAAEGVPVSVQATPDGRLLVQHMRWGSAHGFQAESSLPGVLSDRVGRPRRVENGRDVQGTLGGETAQGRGQVLAGCVGNGRTEGLAIRCAGPAPPPQAGARAGPLAGEPLLAGTVHVAQHGLTVRLGSPTPRVLTVRLDSARPADLARGVETAAGWGALADLRLERNGDAADALRLIAHARGELRARRDWLAQVLAGPLAAHLAELRLRVGKLGAQRPARDAADAAALARRLRQWLPAAQGEALHAQPGMPPGSMLRLLETPPAVHGTAQGRPT
ncbi:MAG: hypothetical protein HY423_03560 [Candidatus Lambdaproteobacteria bacterium]|nr:hypothetical protein [Candidatus Lambdaproteobacteria bacterium]